MSFHCVSSRFISFIHSFIHSSIQSFIHSFVHSCMHSFVPSICSFIPFIPVIHCISLTSFHFMSFSCRFITFIHSFHFHFISFHFISFHFISHSFISFISFFHSFHSIHPFNVFLFIWFHCASFRFISVIHSFIHACIHSFIHVFFIHSSFQSLIACVFIFCISFHFSSLLSNSPTIPISKLVPIVMSYFRNFRPGVCPALSGMFIDEIWWTGA